MSNIKTYRTQVEQKYILNITNDYHFKNLNKKSVNILKL